MKKRLLALMLACVMAFGLVLPAAAATEYPDVVAGHWSYQYVRDMTERGLYNGYTDGRFHPLDPLTTGQAISICVRMSAFDAEVKKAAADDWYDDVYDAVEGEQDWFHDDFAVAVAAGIVTVDELEQLHLTGKLAKGLTREEFSEILVRALQVETPAKAPTMSFADVDEIASEYLIPVHVLSSAGIVVGSLDGGVLRFNPKKIINREESATMFSRAVDYIDKNALILELYDYSTYAVQSGEIVGYKDSVLTIENAITGKVDIELPRTAEVYDGNRLSGTDLLTEGRVARVCSNVAGVFAVRVYDGRESVYTGELRDYDGESVTLNTGTRTVKLDVDRETVYVAGGVTGGAEVYDEEADYSAVTVTVDPTGRMTALRFEGGSRAESVFLREVNEDGTITVATHAGAERTAKLAKNAVIELPDGIKALGAASVGRRCDLRVDNQTEEIVKLTVDGENKYAHGGFVRTTIRTNSRTITVEDVNTSAGNSYKMTTDTTVSVFNEATGKLESKKLGDLVEGQYLTILLDKDNVAVGIEAYPGSSTFTGTLTDIAYGKTITFTVESEDGEVREYTFATNDIPTIKRGNRIITADKLLKGDTITINEKYSKITGIIAAIIEADFTGVVEGINISSTGTVVTIKQDEDGEKVDYVLPTTAEVLGTDGRATTLTAIQGMKVEVTLSGDVIVKIEVKGAATSSGETTGKVLFVNKYDRTLLVELENGSQMSISVPVGTTLMGTDGKTVGLDNIEAEDSLTIYGDYSVDGSFTATLIIKK